MGDVVSRCVLIAAIVVGSRNLQNFDPALVIYTFAIIFATWGVVYHYNVWLDKPPTRMYWRRGWETFPRAGHCSRDSLNLISLDRPQYRCTDIYRTSVRVSAGGCISACSGAAFWQRLSLFRWCSAGSPFARCRMINRST